jgi:hypothetical protein
MFEFTVERAFGSFRRVFDGVLPTFPLPGSQAFREFCIVLRSLGCKADGISLSPQTSRLGDMMLECSLLGGSFILKLSHGWLEVGVPNLTASELNVLPIVLESAIAATIGTANDDLGGSTRISYGGHILVADATPEQLLRQNLTGGLDPAILAPHVCSYRLATGTDASKPEGATVGLAQSRVIDSGLYVEFELEFQYLIEPAAAVERARLLIDKSFHALGLHEKTSEGRPSNVG